MIKVRLNDGEILIFDNATGHVKHVDGSATILKGAKPIAEIATGKYVALFLDCTITPMDEVRSLPSM